MPYSIAYNSGSTVPFGTFKQGNILMGLKPQEYTTVSGFTWYANAETPNDNYLIISDTYSQDWSDQQNSKPTIWRSETGTTESFVSLVNQLPAVNGVTAFTDSGNAMKYLMDSGKYFVSKDDYLGIVTDGLVLNLDAGWYPSYSGSETTWKDIKSANNVTFFNGPTFDSGNGGSIVFDGTDDYGRIPYNSIWNYNNNITLEAWVMVTSSTSGYQGIFGPFSLSPPYNGFNFSISTGTNKLAFLVGNTSINAYYVQQNTQYSLNTWYHLVGIINNGTSRLYVNGVLQNDSTSIAVSPAVGPFMLGKFYDGVNSFLFGGKIGGGRFYNRVLTQSEITQNYNATKGRFGL